MRLPDAPGAPAALALVVLLSQTTSLGAQQCGEPHYRWTAKTDTALASVAPQPTSVTAILTTWAPPDLASRDACALRAGRERRVYRLTAWIRLVDRRKDDGDWHLELTARADSPVDSCIVAEIPLSQYGVLYERARAALDAAVGARKIGRNGVLRAPVLVQITGAAFFDGQHRGGGRRSDKSDGEHGRCNSSVRALWEIHPVYSVTPR